MASTTVDEALAIVQKYCERKLPAEMSDTVRVEATHHGSAITITEHRAAWHPDMSEWTQGPLAQLRFDQGTESWSLFARSSGDRWVPYEGLENARHVAMLLVEVDTDPTGIFWG